MKYVGPSLLLVVPTLAAGLSFDRQWGMGLTFALATVALFAMVGSIVWAGVMLAAGVGKKIGL